jgi:hypothetical protein
MTRAIRPSDLQAAYFIGTGLWPIVHLGSFMAVTGRKRDTWLVQTFGALIAAVGTAMLASRRDASAPRGVGSAVGLALAGAEAVFVARRRIRPIYLADAALELAFVAAHAARLGDRAR